MCNSEACLGYLLLIVVSFFSIFIFLLIKMRKNLLNKDLKISAEQLWQDFNMHFVANELKRNDFIYSIWQDKTVRIPMLLIKNQFEEEIGRVEFPFGARGYQIVIQGIIYKVVVNLTWGGDKIVLLSPEGNELARLERKAFNPRKHVFIIANFGRIESSLPHFDLRMPITYVLNGKPTAFTRSISAMRKIGRVGHFSSEITLPVKFFILSLTLS